MIARIVANPISGGGRSMDLADRLRGHLEKIGYTASIYATQAEERFEALFDQACDLVAVIGGDGTINRVLNALPDNPPPLAIVPTGTANVLARELGLSANLEALCDWIEKGWFREMDTLLCDERRFLLMAGAGLDAEVTRRIALSRKGRWSFLSYARPILQAIRGYSFPPIKLVLDDHLITETASAVVITNVATYGGPMRIAPDADPCDGRFEVCVIRSRSALRFLLLLAHAFLFKRLPESKVQLLQGQRVALTSPEPVPLQLDGDFFKTLPVTVAMDGRKVRIVAPRSQT